MQGNATKNMLPPMDYSGRHLVHAIRPRDASLGGMPAWRHREKSLAAEVVVALVFRAGTSSRNIPGMTRREAWALP